VRHKRFAIDELVIGDREVSVRYCDLLVASGEENTDLDWECLVSTNDEVQLVQGPQLLTLRATGRPFGGNAILVRSDGIAHVFRGIGPLDGFAPSELEETEAGGTEQA
jgi:hypothetical protein